MHVQKQLLRSYMLLLLHITTKNRVIFSLRNLVKMKKNHCLDFKEEPGGLCHIDKIVSNFQCWTLPLGYIIFNQFIHAHYISFESLDILENLSGYNS